MTRLQDKLAPMIQREVDSGRGDYLAGNADVWASSYLPEDGVTADWIRSVVAEYRALKALPEAVEE